MIFVGMVGPQAIAAVSIVFPVMVFFISFIMMIGAGFNGAGNPKVGLLFVWKDIA